MSRLILAHLDEKAGCFFPCCFFSAISSGGNLSNLKNRFLYFSIKTYLILARKGPAWYVGSRKWSQVSRLGNLKIIFLCCLPRSHCHDLINKMATSFDCT